jgi:hypothetical protein
VRTGTVEQLERLAELETALEPRVALAGCRLSGGVAELRLEGSVGDPGGLLVFTPEKRRRPPAPLAAGLPEAAWTRPARSTRTTPTS